MSTQRSSIPQGHYSNGFGLEEREAAKERSISDGGRKKAGDSSKNKEGQRDKEQKVRM